MEERKSEICKEDEEDWSTRHNRLNEVAKYFWSFQEMAPAVGTLLSLQKVS